MERLRMYLIRLLAGNLALVMNAMVYGEVWLLPGSHGLFYRTTLWHWADRPKSSAGMIVCSAPGEETDE